MTEIKTNWYLYMLRCADDTIYTGISIDVQARIDKHNSGGGAKYTSTRLPVRLIYSESHPSRISAMKREVEVRKWGYLKEIPTSKARPPKVNGTKPVRSLSDKQVFKFLYAFLVHSYTPTVTRLNSRNTTFSFSFNRLGRYFKLE